MAAAVKVMSPTTTTSSILISGMRSLRAGKDFSPFLPSLSGSCTSSIFSLSRRTNEYSSVKYNVDIAIAPLYKGKEVSHPHPLSPASITTKQFSTTRAIAFSVLAVAVLLPVGRGAAGYKVGSERQVGRRVAAGVFQGPLP